MYRGGVFVWGNCVPNILVYYVFRIGYSKVVSVTKWSIYGCMERERLQGDKVRFHVKQIVGRESEKVREKEREKERKRMGKGRTRERESERERK